MNRESVVRNNIDNKFYFGLFRTLMYSPKTEETKVTDKFLSNRIKSMINEI